MSETMNGLDAETPTRSSLVGSWSTTGLAGIDLLDRLAAAAAVLALAKAAVRRATSESLES